jgi:two-component system response regulator MprA
LQSDIEQVTTAAPSPSNTIVVVDDEETICETLKDVLEEEGFAVEIAGDGVEALELLRAMSVLPRMIILDLLMPRMDGNTVLTTMRADPALADIPVVISTSDPSRAPSGVLIMRKPVDLDMLLDTVRKQS